MGLCSLETLLLFGFLFDSSFQQQILQASINSTSTTLNCTISSSEYEALRTLYDVCNGPSWQWNYKTPNSIWSFGNTMALQNPCGQDWQGLICSTPIIQNGTQFCNISTINLSDFGLSCLLPDELGNFSGLRTLILSNNTNIMGSIPPELGRLENLQYLDISDCQLTGCIPSELGGLLSLVSIVLDSNRLHGPISDAFIGTTWNETLKYFSVEYNMLTGFIPIQLASLSNLAILNLYHNMFTGSLPLLASSSPQLFFFDCGRNLFTGTIQSKLNGLMAYFYANYNYLDGTIPSLSESSFLVDLSVSQNILSGTIPEGISYLTALQGLYFDGNLLEGSLPSIINLQKLQVLNVAGNHLMGTLPDGILSSLKVASFAENDFFGPLPNLTLPNIISLALSENCFTGTVSLSFCEMRSIQQLLLYSLSTSNYCEVKYRGVGGEILKGIFPQHGMSGVIPSCLFLLPNISLLHLGGNGLEGTIPEAVLPDTLSILDLSYNALSGKIPDSMQGHGKFKQLDLGNNKLTGTLQSYFAVSDSTDLCLKVNRLSGVIPNTLLKLKNIDILCGNLFDCKMFHSHQLPKEDPSSSNYVCGSNQLDASMFFWFCCVCCLIGAVVVFYVATTTHNEITRRSSLVEPNRFSLPSNTVGQGIVAQHSFKSARSVQRSVELEVLHSLSSSLHQVSINSLNWFKYDIRRFDSLTLTPQYLNALMRLTKGSIIIAAVCVGMMAVYMVLKSVGGDVFSTVTVQHSWVTTCAFLHGFAPAVLLLCVVFFVLVAVVSTLKVKDLFSKESIRSFESEHQSVHQRCISSTKFGGDITTFKELILPLCLHLVNIGVGLTANGFYVLYVQKVSPATAFLLQFAISAFNLTWVKVYIPLASQAMKHMSVLKHFQQHVLLLLINSVLIPVAATMVANSSCFNQAIFGSSAVGASFNVDGEFCGIELEYDNNILGNATVSFSCRIVDIPINVTAMPPYIYSYQCGSAVIVSYMPVLFYSYLLTAFMGGGWFFLMHTSKPTLQSLLGGKFYQMFIEGTRFDIDYFDSTLSLPVSVISTGILVSESKQPLFDGLEALACELQDVAMLLTFGLACPLLAVAIALSLCVRNACWRMTIGKYLMVVGGRSPLAVSRLEEAFRDGLLRGAIGGLGVSIVAVSIFWSLILFDMVADQNGLMAGFLMSVVTVISLPLSLYAIFAWRSFIARRNVQFSKSGIEHHDSSIAMTVVSPFTPDSTLQDDFSAKPAEIGNAPDAAFAL